MTTTSPRIVFFGNERLSTAYSPVGAPTLTALLQQGYDVVAVVANFELGRSRKQRKLEIQEVAEAHDIPVLLPAKLRDIKEELAALQADCAVLVAYGKIIPQDIIDIFPKGIINIHPSLLPLYRGSTPIEQAILDGATQTGVSLMQIVKEMDAGPVYVQTALPLQGNEQKDALTATLLEMGASLLVEHLPAILNGSHTPTPQQHDRATYTTLLSKANSPLDNTKTASQLEREVRAFAGWPKSTTTLFGHHTVVTAARVANAADDGDIVLPCGSGTFLEITEVVAPSGRKMTAADFLRGYKK